jgi:hypothetical protein
MGMLLWLAALPSLLRLLLLLLTQTTAFCPVIS